MSHLVYINDIFRQILSSFQQFLTLNYTKILIFEYSWYLIPTTFYLKSQNIFRDFYDIYFAQLFPPLNYNTAIYWICSKAEHPIECVRFREAATGGVLQEKVFLEISQNAQENNCVRTFLFVRVSSLQLY